MPFHVAFTPSAETDLTHFRVANRRVIVDSIRVHLTTDPGDESRRRKRLVANPLAPWELRVGDYRVFYQIEGEEEVTVLAVGVKVHNDLYIRGKKVEL